MNVASRVLVLMVILVATGLVSACAMRSGGGERPGQVLVVLLPDTDSGNVGRVVVSNPEGSTELVTAWASTRVTMTRGAADPDAQRVGGQAAVRRRPRHAASSAAALHAALPVRLRGTDRRRPAPRAGRPAGRQELSGSRRRRGRAHRHHRARRSRTRSSDCDARTRCAISSSMPASRCRRSTSDRMARPSSSCRPLTASSSRRTGASKSPCDDPALAFPRG